MAAGLSVAILMLAQAAYGPAAPAPAKSAAPPQPSARDCAAQSPAAHANEIVVCAIRPQGYRIDPDVLEARREKKQGAGGRPHNPHESYADRSCATVGPMGCRGGPTINLLAAATTLATMADRLSKGQEIGSMFVTDPQKSEYQLYVDAKKRREAKEAEAAAKTKATITTGAPPAQPKPSSN
jgi:hypothetical protein